jgi:PKHD-type hydroxylase
MHGETLVCALYHLYDASRGLAASEVTGAGSSSSLRVTAYSTIATENQVTSYYSSAVKEHRLLYPLPLLTRPLPAAVRVDAFLSPNHCRKLIALAKRKGFETIERSRYGQATFSAAGCWILPEDEKLVFRRFAAKAAEINEATWRLALAGIFTPMSVLKYGPGGWIRPHIDVDYRLADATKLSCVVQLVAKGAFSGGTLTIAETETFDLDIGDAVFFPSHMVHSVSPVESGERYVLAAWAQGPDFT